MIPIFKPSIKRKDMDSVLSCMVSDVIGPATLNERLLKVLCERTGASGGYALRDVARALTLAFRALDLPPGARVALSPLLPWSYLYACREHGLHPVYVDVTEHSPVLDAEALARVQPVDAVVAAATLGYAPDLERLAELGVPIIEDVSHGLGARSGSWSVGSVGSYTICGLEPEHLITAGGGAAVLARGRKERAALKAVADGLPSELFLPDMNAALGLIQALEAERLAERRSEIAEVYSRSAAQSHHKTPIQHGEGQNVHYSYAIFVETGARDVISYAAKKGIEVVPAFATSILGRAAEVSPGGSSATGGSAASDAASAGSTATAVSAAATAGSAAAGGSSAASSNLEGAPAAGGARQTDAGLPPNEGKLPDEGALPNARRFLLRCLLFPLYPMLKKDEVDLVQRVLSTLP